MKRLFFKFCLCLITVLLCISTVSCTPSIYTVTGIENYKRSDSSYGTVRYFLPHCDEPDTFLKKFSYIRGDYDYYDAMDGGLLDGGAYETAILYMEYTEEIYEEAKTYAFQNLQLVEGSAREYKQYTFMQNQGCDFEDQRAFFGHCDEKRILIFIGTYMGGSYEYQYSTLAEYLETYFPFYNWEEGKIERTADTTQENA